VAVPAELAPPLAVSAVPVPPELGVGTLAWPEDLPAPAGLAGLVAGLPAPAEFPGLAPWLGLVATTFWQYAVVAATPPFWAMSALKAVEEY
jgi:hypothetical protein